MDTRRIESASLVDDLGRSFGHSSNGARSPGDLGNGMGSLQGRLLDGNDHVGGRWSCSLARVVGSYRANTWCRRSTARVDWLDALRECVCTSGTVRAAGVMSDGL